MGMLADIDKVLISEDQLQARIVELGESLNKTYSDEDRPLLVCILKGAFMFLADLTRALSMRHEVDFMVRRFPHLLTPALLTFWNKGLLFSGARY